ncbi:MAG TPA: tRNA lysidine(34) synthetase TilS [Chthoniobacterales bacterium]|nr:tRNA lysidine(34) synthetase TilS [Chthoniobacterales bacterium]
MDTTARFFEKLRTVADLTLSRADGLLGDMERTDLTLFIPDQFPAGGRYLVGVSGGRDSVALLHLLLNRGYKNLLVCHLNHRLRGPAAAADARFVEKLAREHGLQCEFGAADVRALAKEEKLSIEAAARVARHRFFAKIARCRRCRTIFLAHHADDLVETFLINLFRGAGPGGLRGIRPVSTHRIEGIELKFVRPFLSVWRAEIDDYIRAWKLKFCEDASNDSLTPMRNRIRRRVIPYIEKQLGRPVRSTIWRAALIAADETEWLEDMVDQERFEGAQLDCPRLHARPRALQRRIIHKWLQTHDVGNLDFELIERVRALLDPDANSAKTNLPQGRHVRRRAKKIFIE